MEQLGELIDGEYIMENCSECQPDHALESIVNREHLIITFSAPLSVPLAWYGIINFSKPCGSGSSCSKVVPRLSLTLRLGKRLDPLMGASNA